MIITEKFTQRLPKIAVCLATYNGIRYLPEQVDSIFAQQGVDVTLFVSVDVSSDGTEAWIDKLVSINKRTVVLPHGNEFGGAAKNFFRIIHDVDFSKCDYISFADQDDIWLPNKLLRAYEILLSTGADAYSCNVIAFWPNGKTRLIDKSQPQRAFDYLFESAGPGCTFLMSPWLVAELKRLLSDESGIACNVALHDWLAYAVCRASGRRWLIDSVPSLNYRQHGKNVLGANNGLKAKLLRFRRISNGWYRQEVLKILDVSCTLSQNPKLQVLRLLLKRSDLLSRIKLIQFIPQFRRKLSDRIFFALMIILGLF